MTSRFSFFGTTNRVLIASLILTAALRVDGQVRTTGTNDAAEMHQLHRMTGRVLAQGSNKEPTGELKLHSFVLEELNLPRPLRAEISGQSAETNRVWRLSVTGGPFVVRAMPALIWIDDTLVGVGVESPDLTRVSVIIFDRTLLREGATISVAYGEHDPQRTDLSEKLKLGSTK